MTPIQALLQRRIRLALLYIAICLPFCSANAQTTSEQSPLVVIAAGNRPVELVAATGQAIVVGSLAMTHIELTFRNPKPIASPVSGSQRWGKKTI